MNLEKNRFIRYREQKIDEGCVRVNLWISNKARIALENLSKTYHKSKSEFMDKTLLAMLDVLQRQEQAIL